MRESEWNKAARIKIGSGTQDRDSRSEDFSEKSL